MSGSIEAPLPLEFFESERPPLGAATVTLELGDLAIRLLGLDDDLAQRVITRFKPFASPAIPNAVTSVTHLISSIGPVTEMTKSTSRIAQIFT